MAGPTLPETHRIASSQGALHVHDYPGGGPTFVLMHGFPDHLGIYDELIPYLTAAGRRVVAFDFLGFGASDKPADGRYSFAQQREDLEAVIGALGLGELVLVPHDSSGIVAVDFALAHPGRVAAMCILNSALDVTLQVLWPEMITLFADPALSALALHFAQSPDQFRWLLEWQQQRFAVGLTPAQRAHFAQVIGPLIAGNFTQPPSAAPAFVEMAAQFYAALDRGTGRLAEVAALEMPVKVIWGTADPYLRTAMGEERARRFRRGSFHPVPAGHWLQSDEPALVAKEMLS